MKRFEKGEYIQYGISGVCLIEDIRQDALSKKTSADYYVLKPVKERASTILVPTDSETLTARMFPLPSREELDALILAARDRDLTWIEDRKERSAQFQLAVKRGGLEELLCMAGCLLLLYQISAFFIGQRSARLVLLAAYACSAGALSMFTNIRPYALAVVLQRSREQLADWL